MKTIAAQVAETLADIRVKEYPKFSSRCCLLLVRLSLDAGFAASALFRRAQSED